MSQWVRAALASKTRDQPIDNIRVLRVDADGEACPRHKTKRLEEFIVRNLRKAFRVGFKKRELEAAGARLRQGFDLVEPTSFADCREQRNVDHGFSFHPLFFPQESLQVVDRRAGIERHLNDRRYPAYRRRSGTVGNPFMGIAQTMNMSIYHSRQYPTPVNFQNSRRCRLAFTFQYSRNTTVLYRHLALEWLSIALDDVTPYN
jgi:hypothetical protein